jgi:hypothetical protein
VGVDVGVGVGEPGFEGFPEFEAPGGCEEPPTSDETELGIPELWMFDEETTLDEDAIAVLLSTLSLDDEPCTDMLLLLWKCDEEGWTETLLGRMLAEDPMIEEEGKSELLPTGPLDDGGPDEKDEDSENEPLAENPKDEGGADEKDDPGSELLLESPEDGGADDKEDPSNELLPGKLLLDGGGADDDDSWMNELDDGAMLEEQVPFPKAMPMTSSSSMTRLSSM